MNNEQVICGKAPAGGMVSQVNGQFYEGGEFMPVTGMSSGVRRAVSRAKHHADFLGHRIVNVRVIDLSGTIVRRWSVEFGYAGENNSKSLFFATRDEAELAAIALKV